MVEKEASYGVCHVVEHRHGFDPFGELVNDHNDILVVITRWRVACHKVHAPFAKGTDSDDRM